MINEIHYSRAFDAPVPEAGRVFRPIVIVEGAHSYEILVFEGDVLRTEDEFDARIEVVEIRKAATIGIARSLAEEATRQTLEQGWVIHHQ